MDAGRPICTCCEQLTDELVTAPRRDGSPQKVCKRCRALIVQGKGWDEVYATAAPRAVRGEVGGHAAKEARNRRSGVLCDHGVARLITLSPERIDGSLGAAASLPSCIG